MLKHILIAGAFSLGAAAAIAHPHGGPGAMLDKADANKDGMVVHDEYLALRAEQFARLDSNSDGFIDATDRASHKAGRHGKRAGKTHGRLDADGDGKISKDEFVNGATPMFDRLDGNDDRVLDAAELEAAKAKGERMRRHRSERPDRQSTDQ